MKFSVVSQKITIIYKSINVKVIAIYLLLIYSNISVAQDTLRITDKDVKFTNEEDFIKFEKKIFKCIDLIQERPIMIKKES